MGPGHVAQGSFTSSRPPTFGNPQNEDYGSFRRDVELWLELTDIPKKKQGIALVGCLLGEPKEFAKTLSTEQLTAENSGMNILNHLDKAYMESDEMILNTRVSNFLEYQRLPTMSITTYIAGFYSRLDNLSQLRMPAELKGHLLLKQANLEITERTMIVASAKGNYEIAAIVNSMKQLFGDRHDIAIAGTTYHTKNMEKRFCNYCKKKNHLEKDCWKKRKDLALNNQQTDKETKAVSTVKGPIYVSFLSLQNETSPQMGLIDSGAVHTIIGKATLNSMMNSLNFAKLEKCSPQAPVHRFGAHGTPIEPEFGVIIPWKAQDTEGSTHSFFFRADVLDGDHPFLIGCPTLISMSASLDFGALLLKAIINGKTCSLQLHKRGNHLFICNQSESLNEDPISKEEQIHETTYYGCNDYAWTQFFLQPDHC
jgi:hypothetical protein